VYVYIQESPVEIQIPAHWNLIDSRLSGRLSCRPAILIHHIQFVLSFPKEKIRHFAYVFFLISDIVIMRNSATA